jgi:hypothetical protein
MLRNFIVYFQRLSIVAGGSTQHTCDMDTDWSGMPWDEVVAASASILDARDGDFRRLEERLKNGATLTVEERELLAEREHQVRPRHRPPSLRVANRGEIVEGFLRAAVRESGWTDKQIVSDTMTRFNMGRSAAYAMLKKVKDKLSR